MMQHMLEKISISGLNRLPDVPMGKILLGFALVPAVQAVFLLAGIAAICLSDGWTYVWVIFIQTILTIIAEIVLSNLRDAYLNRYYHSQFLETLHLNSNTPVLREAHRIDDRNTERCIRLTPVPTVTTMIVNLILIFVYSFIHS